ncbi:MAG TPA: ribonuclease J [Drouetiella sp.]
MTHIVTGDAVLKFDGLAVIPLGGQSELGQVMWALVHSGKILLVDAGSAYPVEEMPGVDLLFPNTNFLKANEEHIVGLVLTNAHAEHSGAVSFLLNNLAIPTIMGPRYVSTFLAQCSIDANKATGFPCPIVETVEIGESYELDPFEIEWVQVNDAIADACALKIGTPKGTVIYTSSFKVDQTPVDNRLMDVRKLAEAGDNGVLLLIGDSSGVEIEGYTPSEKAVIPNLRKAIEKAPGRAIVVMPGTNTHRLQILFDIAQQTGKKVALLGETLTRTAVSAAITGNLIYDRSIEASIEEIQKLPDSDILILASGQDGDAMEAILDLAYTSNKDLLLKDGDTVIYSAGVAAGRSRQMAMILDNLLALGVHAVYGARTGVHVSKHASREELKFMLSIINPKYFVPALGEGRHIMHHAQMAIEWGIPAESIYPLRNGDVLEIENGSATIVGTVEAQPVMFNREQSESVSQFSVSERRSLSTEGVVSVGLVVDGDMRLVSGPTIEVGAAGFMQSSEWEMVRPEIEQAIIDAVARMQTPDQVGNEEPVRFEMTALRAAVREVTTKAFRSKLQSKPTVQVMIHELLTK